jgi:hypothetical protein
MPTVLSLYGLRVVVYPNDHRPAHVHVMGRDCEAVFNLNCPGGPTALRENYGFSLRELNRIAAHLDAQAWYLCQQWKDVHGYF